MKFRSDLIHQLLNNEGDTVGNTIRAISPDKKIVIAQGYGAHAKIPVRFLTYAIPSLRLLAQMPQTAQVELYIAAKGSARANTAYYQGNMYAMAWLLQRYVDEYYTQHAKQVRILGDTGQVPKAAEQFIEHLFTNAAVPIFKQDEQINTFANKRGGDSALRYMVEHLLYMRDPIMTSIEANKLLMVPRMCTDFDHLIMVGGPSEKIFYKFRQEVLRRHGSHSKWQSHQFFTPIGDPPPYHWQQGEPIIGDTMPETYGGLFTKLRTLPGEDGKQKNLLRDYAILLQDLAGVSDFKLPGKVKPEIFEKGYERLKEFLNTYL